MKRKGFTLIEMIFCISVILVILLLVIPNVTSKNRVVKEKSCEAPPIPAIPSPFGECRRINIINKTDEIICIVQINVNIMIFSPFS